MKIKIVEKLAPFSHLPGAACVIPGTCWEVEAFPTLIRIGKHEIRLHLTGPVHDFTLQQDLERHCVFVFGKAKEGYYKIRIEASDSGFDLAPEKGKVLKGKVHVAEEIQFVPKKDWERLSLGNHKSQDWDLVKKRCDLTEILPLLFCLGQKIPRIPPQPLKGTARLLEMPEERNELDAALKAFFKAAFKKILVPRLIDDHMQGIVPEEDVKGDRFFLIQEGAKMVRGLFFKQNERRLGFLPHLPVSLHAGRMIGIKAPGIGEIDFEWSKKTLRSVIIRATTSGEVILELGKELKTLRVRSSPREKGKRQSGTEPVLLAAGKTVYLDRFQK